jgi:intracellular septation protein A
MKLPLALLWRIYAVQIAITLVLFVAFSTTDMLTGQDWAKWRHPMMLAITAGIHLVYLVLAKRSLIQLVFGARVPFSQLEWNTVTMLLSGLYLLLAVAIQVVATVASPDTWRSFKLLAPFIALVAFSMAMPSWLKRTTSE